ncbi:MAG: membrane protein insertase YidC, partial [Paracoccaceae bacterium]|nr:membrane protein insertase YidC [Paracoccaceae bacterium]
MDDQNKNLILATVLSFAVIVTWTTLFPPEDLLLDPATEITQTLDDPTLPTADPMEPVATTPTEESEQTAEAPRVAIETGEFRGSLSLLGGRIDDLALTNYRETVDEESAIVRLLRPVGERGAYFASFGWTATEGIDAAAVPGPDTLWSLESGSTLTPTSPVTIVWDNGAGQVFRTEISVDDAFMFTFDQSVENASSGPVSARPYGLIRRHGQ